MMSAATTDMAAAAFPTRIGRSRAWLRLLVAALLLPVAGFAQTWIGGSTTWSTAGNWSGGVPGNTATATFNSNTANDPNLTATAQTGKLLFLAGSDAEVFTGSALTLNGVTSVGIDNQSGVTQTFNNNLTVGANQTWTASSGDLTFSTVTLTGNLTLTGSTTFTFGSTLLNSGGNRTFTNDSSGTVTLSGAVSLSQNNTGRTLTFGGTGDTDVSGAIGNGGSGAGNIVKTGTGTLTLSGANTYTGATTVGTSGGTSGGTLLAGASNVLSGGTTTVYAGNLDLNGNSDTIGALTLGGGASGTTAAVATGAGTLTLGGNVTYSATNNPNGATVSGNLALGGADRTFTVGDSSGATDDLTVSAVISGSNAIIKAGTGTLVLSGANTYTGTTSVNGGILNIQNSAALGTTGAGTTVTTGEELQLQGGIAVGAEALSITGTGTTTGALVNISDTNSFAGVVTLAGTTTIAANAGSLTLSGGVTGTNRSLTVTGAGDVAITGGLTTGSGTLTKTGAGTLTLSGTSSYTGATTIGTSGGTSGGTLRTGAADSLSNNTTTVYAGTLDLNGNNDAIGALTLGGGASGTTAAVTTGAGTLTLGGNVTYTATNNPNGATISGNLALGGADRTFTIGNSTGAADDLTVSAAVSGSNAIIKQGTGTLVLSGANTYTGTTTVSAGILNIQNSSALGTTAGGTVVNTGTELQVQGGIAVGAETLSIIGTGTGSAGALRNISGDNSWSGAVTLTGTTQIYADAGSLTLSGGITGTNRALTIDGAGDFSIGGITTGTGTLTKNGGGTTTLTGTSTYTGATTVNAGTLQLGASNALADTMAVTLASGATFDVNGFTDTIATLAGTGGTVDLGGGSLTTAGAGSTTYSGVLTGGGSFTKQGAGVLTLDSTTDFNFNGTFNLEGGTLRLSDLALTVTTLNITGNSIIDFTGVSSLSVGTLNIVGSFTLTIQNWANASDFFFAQNWTGASYNTSGSAPMNQITFNGATAADTKWLSYEDNVGTGYHQITPVPEPSTYGALLLVASGGLLCWRRRRAGR